jgi:lipoate-protein ligase A
MKLIEQTFSEPAENVAFDEALLLDAEQLPGHSGFLRIWEPDQIFVVVGRGSAISREVDLARCGKDNVPVLRRSSGGAAIVAGPGCLMYAVVLAYEQYPALRAIDEAHRFVLSTIATSLSEIVSGIERQGISDLAVAGRKVSGNALRCRSQHLLYHGTLLYDMTLADIGRYLHNPHRQPEYREGRAHTDFVANMSISREALREAVISGWQASAAPTPWSSERTGQLVTEKYSRPGWTMQIP